MTTPTVDPACLCEPCQTDPEVARDHAESLAILRAADLLDDDEPDGGLR